MAESLINSRDFITARAEVDAATLGAAFAAVSFSGVAEFQCEGFTSLHVMGKAATQDADVKVQVRNHADDDWVDLATAATLSAGTAADVYEGAIRAARFRIAAKDTLTAGGSVDISFCLARA